MGKVSFKPGNMLYPIPAVMVSVADKNGNDNILTIAWTGTLCTNPPKAYICVRPERHSHEMIKESGEFVINLTTEKLARATDFCGVKSGRTVDKFKEARLTREKAQKVKAPLIAECPVNIECKVRETKNLGSHTMFIADVVAVNVDDQYMDKNGKFDLNKSNLLVYSHGEYFGIGDKIGKFGYSVDKKYVSKAGKSDRNDKGGKSDRFDKAGKSDRFDKAGKPDRPAVANASGRPDKAGRSDRSGQSAKYPGKGQDSRKQYTRGSEVVEGGRNEESPKAYGRGIQDTKKAPVTKKKSVYKKKFGK